MLLSPPIFQFLIIDANAYYFSYCSTSAVSPDSSTFHGKMQEQYNGADGDRRENFYARICLHNHSHHVCFEALLVAKALQNRFSIDTKELLPKAVCTRAKRGKQNLHKVFFAMVHVLHRLLETTRDSSAIWEPRTQCRWKSRLMDTSYSKFRIRT